MKNKFSINWTKVGDLYNKGLTDRAIGKRFHCGYQPIFDWRHKNGLPANHFGRGKVAKRVLVGVGVAAAGYLAYKKMKEKKEKE